MKIILHTIIVITIPALVISCQSQPRLGFNEEASVRSTDDLPENPLLLHAITSGIQPKDSTMFTLYGNDTAFSYAGSHSDNRFPYGAVLYEVTWRQQTDEQWIGANVPKEIITIERVEYTGNEHPIYTLYKGTPLKKIAGVNPDLRLEIICGQRMAVSP
ncbi:MAG TPA: hypothetical protein VIM79_03970 [Niastella sp.]